MATPFIEQLKERFSYQSWRGRRTMQEYLFIWKFFFSGDEISNWKPNRIERLESLDAPRIIQSLWEPAMFETRSQALLNVQSFECASMLNAHDFLLRLLGEFQSPLITRWDQSEIGDVTFTAPDYGLILFARGNLVQMVRNAERGTTPVVEAAKQLDLSLAHKPESDAPKPAMALGESILADVNLAPRILRLSVAAEEVQVGSSVPLELKAADPLANEMMNAPLHIAAAAPLAAHPLQYKIFSYAGEVHEEDGQLIYTPKEEGPQNISVYVINATKKFAKQTLQLIAK